MPTSIKKKKKKKKTIDRQVLDRDFTQSSLKQRVISILYFDILIICQSTSTVLKLDTYSVLQAGVRKDLQ